MSSKLFARPKPFLLFISVFLTPQINAQVAIKHPVGISLTDVLDSSRLVTSRICIGDTIINSKKEFDLRIYRFMAFGDYKLIRISTSPKRKIRIDLYSLNMRGDSVRYHKVFNNSETDSKIREMLMQYDILNLPDLNYDFVTAKSLPGTRDGNFYQIEAKVGNDFTYKMFENPEFYSKYFATQVRQAKVFTEFIKGLERILNVNISEFGPPY